MKHRISHKKYNGHRVYRDVYDPLNPLNLPPFTMRVQLTDTSFDCSNKGFRFNGNWTRVDNNGTWDVTYVNSNWSRLLRDSIGFWGYRKVHKILGFNSTGVTNMERFDDCAHEYLIGTIPLFDTTTLTDVAYAFYETYYIEGGQYALYRQMSSQAIPPTSHDCCFSFCGANIPESKEETLRIANDWR